MVALGAGVAGAIQPKVNAELGDRLGSAVVAALVNFGVAWVLGAAFVAARPSTRALLLRVGRWPVPRWTYAAGLGGAVVVLSGVVAVRTIGVAVFSIAFFAGQLTFGLVVDRLGLAASGPHAPGRSQIEAAVIAMTAVVLTQVGRPLGDIEPALVAFVVAAGAASAVQTACNGRITNETGDALAATVLNTTVGMIALAAVVAALAVGGAIDALHWPSDPVLYTGGVLGMAIVLSLAVASAAVGVLRTTLAMLAAQLTAAVGVDWVVRHEAPTLGVVAGAVLIVIAVLRAGTIAR